MSERTLTNSNDLVIQRLAPGEIKAGFAEALFEVANTGFKNKSPWSVAQLDMTLDSENTLIIYASINQKVVGFIMASVLFDEVDVFIVVVSEAYKKQSIGTKLFNYLFQYCKEQEIKRMVLETRKSNEPAIGLYKRVGFSKVGVRKAYYTSPIEDAIVMQKEI